MKYDADVRMMLTRSGSRPLPLSVAVDCDAAEIDATELACARRSVNVR